MSFNLLLSFPDFNVTIYTSSTKLKEGATVNLNCTHDVPEGTISVAKDNEQQAKKETISNQEHSKNCSLHLQCW